MSLAPPIPAAAPPKLKRELRLADLVPMQVLLVFGVSWVGTAARLGSAHLLMWLAAIVAFFIPQAMTVAFCAGVWPEEGGVYQWTRHSFGPAAGFFSAWNFGLWAVLTIASLGVQLAATLHYAFGPAAAWMETSTAFTTALAAAVILLMAGITILGLHTGKWVAHFGTAVLLAIIVSAVSLLFIHPGATAAHPHVAPQRPFSLALPAMTLLSLNIFSKLAFYGLGGLEQVAVFADEIKHPSRDIARSAAIAAPVIAILYIAATGAALSYTPADKIDLNGPIPQLLSAGLAGAGRLPGLIFNLVVAVAMIAQFATIVAETSRLPMVAAWDRLVPPAFTRLHPRYRTPVAAILLICAAAFLFSVFASISADTTESFQVMSSAANFGFCIYYVLMFAVPLLAGTRASRRPDLRVSPWLRFGCVPPMALTVVAIGGSFLPIVPVSSAALFAAKVAAIALGLNAVGGLIYARAKLGSTSFLKKKKQKDFYRKRK